MSRNVDTFLLELRRAALALPAAQQEGALGVAKQLENLLEYVRDFHADLTLFDNANHALVEHIKAHKPLPSDVWPRWMHIACRDAAMNVFHFGKSLEALLRRYKTCDAWRGKADFSVLRPLQREFGMAFPKWERIRHAVGHRAELSKSPEELKKHSTPSGAWRQENLDGRTFHMTYEGKPVSCELSIQKLSKLNELFERALTAFVPLVEAAGQPKQG